MNQRFFRYILPLALTVLCGLYFVHSNLKVEDFATVDTKESILQFNEVDQQANIGVSPLSTNKKFAVEIAECEEQEEEVRHSITSEHSKYLGFISATLTRVQWSLYSLFESKKSFAALIASDTTFPFRRYIKYQVFRL